MDLNSFSADGFTIESNHEVPEDVRAQIGPAVKEASEAVETGEPSKSEPRTIKPIPPEKEVTRQHVDQSGKEHGEDGRFKGKGGAVEALGDEGEPKPEAKPADPQPEPKRTAKARIHELNERVRETERLLAQERRDRERLLQERAQTRQEPTQAGPEVDPYEPQEDQFPDHKSYTKALAKYEAQKLYAETRAQEQAERYAAYIQQSVGSFRETVEKAGGDKFLSTLPESIKNLKPTYSLAEGEKPGPLNFLANEILHSQRSVELMRYLADNPSVLRRFSSPLEPRDYERLMGKIEAALDAATAGTPAQDTSKPKAPPFEPKGSPPIRPVNGGPHNVDSDDDLDEQIAKGAISFEEYNKRANARERAKRHA